MVSYLQKGDDDYDKRNSDAHNVIQGNHRPEVMFLVPVRCLCTLGAEALFIFT